MENWEKKKIGFLYIDKSYAVYHSISIAIELEKDSKYQIHILCTYRNYALIKKTLERYNCKGITIKVLRPYWYFTLPHYFEIKLQFRKSIFTKYANFLNQFDAFVCTIYDDLYLKKVLKKQNSKKYIFTDHGVANRIYAFDNKILDFNLFFIKGEKEKQIREKLGQLNASNHVVTGFVKFDLIKTLPKLDFFNNDNPTILYNPHWERQFTSFFKFGESILDFFVNNPNYNLIFAPHALLLERNWVLWFKMLKYRKYKNIIIDMGSELSNDMSYIKDADLFLGDVSSQVFEFLFFKTRPCLFLDAHNMEYDKVNRPLSWDLGEIISNVANFEENLKAALLNHSKKFKNKQSDKIREMFHRGDISPTQIATKAIEKLLSDNQK
jgi:hypothetical protein